MLYCKKYIFMKHYTPIYLFISCSLTSETPFCLGLLRGWHYLFPLFPHSRLSLNSPQRSSSFYFLIVTLHGAGCREEGKKRINKSGCAGSKGIVFESISYSSRLTVLEIDWQNNSELGSAILTRCNFTTCLLSTVL